MRPRVRVWHRAGHEAPPLSLQPVRAQVQMALDLAKIPHEVVEVPYLDRSELVRLTGGYIQVPVLELDDGTALFDSRAILEWIAPRAPHLVPSPWDGPIWAYADWVDGPFEDVLFRIASPDVRDAWPTAAERALYVYIKERKFGAGCVDAWSRDRPAMIDKVRALLAPTFDGEDAGARVVDRLAERHRPRDRRRRIDRLDRAQHGRKGRRRSLMLERGLDAPREQRHRRLRRWKSKPIRILGRHDERPRRPRNHA